MKRLALVACLLMSLGVAAPAAADEPVCTRVFGFSQTRDWWHQFEAQSGVVNAEWEGVTPSSADVRYWANPDSSGWTGPKQLESKCPIAPTRAVFQVAYAPYATTDDATIEADLRTAIANVGVNWPSIQQVILVPVVGGPNHGTCVGPGTKSTSIVDATIMHPRMDTVIAAVIDGVQVLAGPDLLASACTDFRDDKGHLTVAGASYIASIVEQGV